MMYVCVFEFSHKVSVFRLSETMGNESPSDIYFNRQYTNTHKRTYVEKLKKQIFDQRR